MDTQAHMSRMETIQRNALIAAVVGIIGCIAGVLLQPGRFFASYLLSFVFKPNHCISGQL